MDDSVELGRAFLRRADEAAGPDGRLPLGPMSQWEVFPFEADSLRVRPLLEFAVPEPDRSVTATECSICRTAAEPDRALGGDDRFVVVRAPTSLFFAAQILTRDHRRMDDLGGEEHAALGRLLGATYDALRALPGVGGVHLDKWENGKGHLAFRVTARPEGVLQLRGSNLSVWADLLSPTPETDLAERAEQVRRALGSPPT